MWFFLSLYLQQVYHYGALETGLAFLPMTLTHRRGVLARAPAGGALRHAQRDHRRHALGARPGWPC